MTVAELTEDSVTVMSGAFSAKNARTDSMLMRCNQAGQFRQRMDAIVGSDPEFIHLGADRLEHRERGNDLALHPPQRHLLRCHPLAPSHIPPHPLLPPATPLVPH